MVVFNAKSTRQKWSARGLLPSRLIISFGSLVICGPVVCDPQLSALPRARHSVTTPQNSLVFAEALGWVNFFILRGGRVRILFDSKHAASVTLGIAHA